MGSSRADHFIDNLLQKEQPIYDQHLRLFLVSFSLLTLFFAGIESYLGFSSGNVVAGWMVLFGVVATAANLQLYSRQLYTTDTAALLLISIFFGFFLSILITGVFEKLTIYWIGFFAIVTMIVPPLNKGVLFIVGYLLLLLLVYLLDLFQIYTSLYTPHELRHIFIVIMGSSLTGLVFNYSLQRYQLAIEQENKKVRQGRRRFQSFADIASDWLWEVDQQGRFTYVGQSILQHLGYENSEVVGKTIFDFYTSEHVEKIAAEFEKITDAHRPFSKLVTPHLHKNGTEHWCPNV